MGLIELQRSMSSQPRAALDEAAYQRLKQDDFRRPSAMIAFAGAFLVFSLWLWDWAIDARHAPDTFWLRVLLSISFLPYPLALMAGVRRLLPLVFYATVLWLQVVFLLILGRLDGGAVHGIGGFMFWFIVPPLMSFILRLRDNILGNLAVLAFPSLLAGPFGLLPEMDLLRLNALIVPAGLITIAGHAMIDRLLRRIYEYRWQFEWRALAIDALAEGVVIIQEGAIRYANLAAAALIGRKPAQIVGAALREFVNIDERTDLSRPLRVDAPEGRAAWVRVSQAAIAWQGRPATLVAVADVTEQQRADEALRKSEEHYRSVIDNVSETIIIAQGNRLVFANPRAEELTGFTVAELTARPFVQLLHPDDVARVADRYGRRMRGEEAERYTQFRVLRRGGGHVWVESSAVRILWNGEPATLAFLGDLTERRKTEEALRRSEERYRLLVDHASEGILISQDGILRFVNPRIAALTGRSEAELVGQPLLDHIHADDRQVLIERNRKRRRGEPLSSHEMFRLIRADGGIVWIEFSGVDVEWEGRPAVLSFLIDITERRRLEDSLKQTLDERETILERSIVGIALLDPKGRLRWANKAMGQIFGVDTERILGVSLEPYYFSREAYMETGAAVSAAVLAGRPYEAELLMRRADGRLFWAQLSGKAVNASDLSQGTVWAIVDIDQRKRLEDELKRTSAERELILQSALVGIIYSRERRYVWVNRAFADMLGYRQDELIGQSSRILFPNEKSWREFGEQGYPVMARGEPFSVEWQMVRRDGTPFWAQTLGRNVDPADPRAGSIWTIVDITARKQAEEETRAALEKQKELNYLKSRFVSMTSHEFRTPLATILSSAELLKYYGGKLPETERAELIDAVEGAVRRMTRMMDDILVIGRAEADRLECAPVPLDVRDFCTKVISETVRAEEAEGRRGDRIVFDMPAEGILAPLDEKLARFILGNLLSNGLKYSPNGGAVALAVRADDAQLRFTVTDSGIGIPAEDIPHLFEPFHRAKNVGTLPGTGLGLAIVKKAVDLHGGRIEVSSVPGQGSRFDVTLPM